MNTSQNTTHTPSEAQKHPRSTAGTQQQQYTSSGTTQVNLATLPPFQLATHPGFQVIHIPKRNLVLILLILTVCIICLFFFGKQTFSLPVAGLFYRSRLRGTQGARLLTTVQVWVPAGLYRACCGRSKSRNLASNHGVAFRGARAEQDNGKPNHHLLFFFAPPSHARTLASSFSRSCSDGRYYACRLPSALIRQYYVLLL